MLSDTRWQGYFWKKTFFISAAVFFSRISKYVLTFFIISFVMFSFQYFLTYLIFYISFAMYFFNKKFEVF